MKKWFWILIVLSGISLVIVGPGQSQAKVLLKNLPQNTHPEIKQLIERLYSQDPVERVTALSKLGENSTNAVHSIPFVIPLLGDTEAVLPQGGVTQFESTDVASEAVKVLAKLGQPAVEPLIHALGDNNSIIRANAIEALGVIGDMRAEDPLMTILIEDKDVTVRQSSAEALGRLGDSRSLKSLTVALSDRRSKVQESARKAIQEIIHEMKDKHELTPCMSA